MKMFLTFGQAHTHYVEGRNFDKDTVAVVYGKDEQECDEIAFGLFDGVFHQHVPEHLWNHEEMMQYFPKGYVPVNPPRVHTTAESKVVSAYLFKRPGSNQESLVAITEDGNHISFVSTGYLKPELYIGKSIGPGLLPLNEYDIVPEDERIPVELPDSID